MDIVWLLALALLAVLVVGLLVGWARLPGAAP